MMRNHINLLFPQWQGGPVRQVYHGAMQLAESFSDKLVLQKVPVELSDDLPLEKGIRGYCAIMSQLEAAHAIVGRHIPDTVFTIGGNCSCSIVSIDYLNWRCQGDLAVVWLDTHGDLNTPESSPSNYFTGMPLRHLLGEGDAGIGRLALSKLKPEQIILAGARCLDVAEAEYIKMTGIKNISPAVLAISPETVTDCISAKGYKNVYIHVDTDVLTGNSFQFSAWPSDEGIDINTLSKIIESVAGEFRCVGGSLVEFLSCDESGMRQLQVIVNKILFALGQVP